MYFARGSVRGDSGACFSYAVSMFPYVLRMLRSMFWTIRYVLSMFFGPEHVLRYVLSMFSRAEHVFPHVLIMFSRAEPAEHVFRSMFS